MRKLYNLKMKESNGVTTHFNEFDNLFTQIRAQRMQIDDEMKAIHLLCSLPPSWDTLYTTISNSAKVDGLLLALVESSLLIKEVNKKNLHKS